MAYPTGTPVQERALQNLQTALEAIAGAPSFYTTLAPNGVHRNKGDNLLDPSIKQYPTILIIEGEVSKDENSAWPMVECVLPVVLRCGIARRDGVETELRKFAADVAQAVRANYRLADGGGDVALVAAVTGEQAYQSDGVSPIGAVDVVLSIRYRYLYDDPNTPI